MGGPAYYSGTISIAKNEDWVVPFLLQQTVPYDPWAEFPPTDLMTGGDKEDLASLTEITLPIDLTGSTISMQIRKIEADSTAVVSVTNGDGVNFDNAPAGLFTITILRAKLGRLHAGPYVADIVRLTPTGLAERLWEGSVTVFEGVTR
jgi:hypothetical protein